MPGPDGAARAHPAPDIELLDAPSVRTAAGTRAPLERKLAALLALLALDGARGRTEAAALLWPDAEMAQARNSLRQRLFRLQRVAGRSIVSAGQELLQLADGLSHDLDDPHEPLAADPQARVGELLGGFDYSDCLELGEWVDTARARWRERRASALAEMASRHEGRGEIALALRYAQRAVIDEPLREHAHRRVMRLHYLRGDRAAALAAFEQCRERLLADLNAKPDRETAELARLIASGAGPAAPRAAAPPVSVLRPPLLVGRETERARLDAALAERRVLLLRGDPGMGKTRLLEDTLHANRFLLGVEAHAGEAGLPYALAGRLVRAAQHRFGATLDPWVVQELARLAPELGPAPAGRLDSLRLHQALAAALDAWADAGLAGIAVDDLHHADEASIEALLARATATRASRLGWVFAVRSQEMPAAVGALCSDAAETGVEVVTLDGLDRPHIEALLECLELAQFDPARWAAPLAAHSGGNPLFALETVRALMALGAAPPAPTGARLPVPAGLGSLIERRLMPLSSPALRLARLAALAGSDFDPDLAAAVLDVHPLDVVDAWSELEQAQILRQGRFTHDLIAEAVRRGLPEPIAVALHGRLADRMGALGRASARIAPHWAAAGAWRRAGDAYAAAARDAQRASRRSDEVALWEQAARCYDEAGLSEPAFDARADSIESVILVRGVPVAMALAQRLAGDSLTELHRIRALTAEATVCLMASDAAAGETAARAALDAATCHAALWPRFEAARLLAVALTQSSRIDEALAAIEPFRDPVEAGGTLEQRGHFWSDYAYVLKGALRLRDTADALRRAMQCAEALGDFAELATLTSNLATVEGNFGHVEQALEHAKRARALSDPLGEMGGPAAGAIDMYIAIYSAAVGRYGDALANLDRADACFSGNGQTLWSAVAANHRANLLIHLGQYARAGQALAAATTTMAAIRGRSATLAARLDRALGRSGVGANTTALGLFAQTGDSYLRMLAELEASFDLDPDEAIAACRRVEDEAERMEHDGVAWKARTVGLQHRLRAGPLGADEIDLLPRFAASLASVQPADIYPPEAWWTLHRAWLAAGDESAADAALASGFEWAVQRALPQVPQAFRESFLHRNPINRDLIAAFDRRVGRPLSASR